MKPNRILTALLFLLLASVLTACAGTPMASSWPGVSAEEDHVYLANATFVYAINSDGTMVWRYPSEKADASKHFYARPLVTDNQVIVGDYRHTLYSLDANTGAERWTFSEATDRFIGSATAADGLILAPSADNYLYALDTGGVLQWKFEAGDAIWAQPVSNGKQVFIGSMDHFVYALDLASGRMEWSADLGAAIVYSLTLNEETGTLYAGTVANQLIALNAENGAVEWRAQTGGNIWGRPIINDGSLFIGDQSGKIYGFSAQDGSKLWEAEAGSPVIASGTLAGEELVFTTEAGAVMALDFAGKKLWNQAVNGKLYSSPAYTGDRLYVPVTGGDQPLLALNPNGTQVWGFIPPK